MDDDDSDDDDEPKPAKKQQTPARQRQLARIREQRSASHVGPAHFVETEVERKLTRRGYYLPSVDELCAKLRELAMGGTMPSIDTFNANRPANWSIAQAHMHRLGYTWNELAREAGLKANPTRHGK